MPGESKENKLVLCFRKIRFPVKKKKSGCGRKALFGMGCVCSKGANDEQKVKKEKGFKKSKKRLVALRKEEVVVEVDNGGNDATTRLISVEPTEKSAGSTPALWVDGDKKKLVSEKPTVPQMQRKTTMENRNQLKQPQVCKTFNVRNGDDGAQVVAGWPSWLTSVAGEAIKGWIPRKADSFERLDKIGQGTYSSVYRARDLETGKTVALKKVRFVNMDPESVRFMAREILILRRLDHPNVMKLEGLLTSRVSGNLYLIFEYMEHDLAGLGASPLVHFTEPQIKCFIQQLLRGLEHCHSRGVLHRDIKGSNLLIDSSGNLKIADFGLATFFRAKQKQPLTSRVVTLWYRPPELLLGSTDYGVAVDLWSSGCIIAELFAGKPIMPGRTEVEQLHKIFKLCGAPAEEYWKKSKLPNATIFKPQHPYRRCVAETFKDFPPSALSLLESLLAFEPDCRGTATSALHSEFFTAKPLPCDPSSLPRYPPSKEYDVKMRDEEARRQRASVGRGVGVESLKKQSKAVPAPDTNAELHSSIQKWKGQSNPKSNSEMYNPEENRPRGSFMHGHGMGYRELKTQRSLKPHLAAQLSKFSNSVVGSSQFDFSNRVSGGGYEEMSDAESSNHLLLGKPQNNGFRENSKRLKKKRMQYSGPLLAQGGSVEEMLKEHEKQIQIAVRKAQIDKNNKMRKGGDATNGKTVSLLGG